MAKNFTPCDLGRGKDGNVDEYFAKTTGFGYNDMISLPTLTKESILENLARRFKVRDAQPGALTASSSPQPAHLSRAAQWAEVVRGEGRRHQGPGGGGGGWPRVHFWRTEGSGAAGRVLAGHYSSRAVAASPLHRHPPPLHQNNR